jgi:hypothetical protein
MPPPTEKLKVTVSDILDEGFLWVAIETTTQGNFGAMVILNQASKFILYLLEFLLAWKLA